MQILTKVSFDPHLFTKELKKAFQWISLEEKSVLKKWCLDTFGKGYKDIIESIEPEGGSKADPKATL